VSTGQQRIRELCWRVSLPPIHVWRQHRPDRLGGQTSATGFAARPLGTLFCLWPHLSLKYGPLLVLRTAFGRSYVHRLGACSGRQGPRTPLSKRWAHCYVLATSPETHLVLQSRGGTFRQHRLGPLGDTYIDALLSMHSGLLFFAWSRLPKRAPVRCRAAPDECSACGTGSGPLLSVESTQGYGCSAVGWSRSSCARRGDLWHSILFGPPPEV
jgi:hypothetical protein